MKLRKQKKQPLNKLFIYHTLYTNYNYQMAFPELERLFSNPSIKIEGFISLIDKRYSFNYPLTHHVNTLLD